MKTFKDFGPGVTLISSDPKFKVDRANKKDVDQYREHMQKMFRSDRLPAVKYKDRILAERVLG